MTELFGEGSGATISECGKYRYRLWRAWNLTAASCALWIMLNSSTAGESKNDPTATRCIGFTKRFGFGGLEIVNFYAFRTPEPKVLRQAQKQGIDIVGPDNDSHIRQALELERNAIVIAAWGAAGDEARSAQVQRLIADAGRAVYCLGLTKDGQPRHPLMVPYSTKLVRFPRIDE